MADPRPQTPASCAAAAGIGPAADIDEAVAAWDTSGGAAIPSSGRNKWVVVCCGVRGVWRLQNGAEVSILERLGGSSDGVSRLQGLDEAMAAEVAVSIPPLAGHLD